MIPLMHQINKEGLLSEALTSSVSSRLGVLMKLISIGSLILSMSACTSPIASKSCDNSDDCTGGKVCRASLCVDPVTDMAPSTVECYQSSDCGETARCVEGTCIQNECREGETQPCMTTCGTGEQLCSGGVWRACNNQPTSEVCGTGEDEDCDGLTDEGCGGCNDGEERVCSTSCGEGRERCFGGQFRGCTATRPQQTEFCGDPNQPVDEDCDGEVDEGCDQCEGQSPRSCETACGVGNETCIENTWRNCSAPQPTDELCDAVDNDCDGVIDEDIIRSCDNLCGAGFERCNEGVWVGCDAPENCLCSTEEGVDLQVCGACGQRARTCDTPEWGEWEECQMSGQCTPGQTEDGPCGLCGTKRRRCVADCQWGEWQMCNNEGVCAAGDEEREACPSGCGERVRICGDQCEWGEWSDCSGADVECSPGQEEQEVCGACGEQRQRVCGDQCRWEAWGECVQSGCTPGEVEDRPCGACQTESRVCSESCEWGEWSACQSGSCTPGDTESRECGNCGQQVRTCTTNCGWSDWSDCDGQGECAPGAEESLACGESDVGACSLGTQINACNDQCRWVEGECRGATLPSDELCGSLIDSDCDGVSLTNPDQYESNNTCNACTSLMVNPRDLTITATIDNINDDWDYYCFQTDDGFTPLQSINVSLTNVPANADYDLFLYESRAECANNNYLAASTNGRGEDDSVSWGEGFGDDSGIYVIGVRALFNTHSCNEAYLLTVSGF